MRTTFESSEGNLHAQKMLELNKEERELIERDAPTDVMDAFYERKNEEARAYIDFENRAASEHGRHWNVEAYYEKHDSDDTYYDKIKVPLPDNTEFTMLVPLMEREDVHLYHYLSSLEGYFEDNGGWYDDQTGEWIAEMPTTFNYVPFCVFAEQVIQDAAEKQDNEELILLLKDDTQWITLFSEDADFAPVLHEAVNLLSEEECIKLLKSNISEEEIVSIVKHIEDQTPELCMAAVQQNGLALRFVKEQTPELCMAAVQRYGSALEYVKDQTPELCMAAVQQNSWALEYVKEQTPELCMAAVQRNGTAIEYVKEQTPELCMAAVQQNSWALEYVKEQTPELCMAAVQKESWALEYVKDQTPEICLAAVQKDGLTLEAVKEQTPELCMAAVQRNGSALRFVKEQTPELCMAAVQRNGTAIEYVKEQTPELCMAAVQRNGMAIEYVKEQTPELCMAAVQQNSWALEYVKDQTPEICLAAVQQDGLTLEAVKEQTPELCMAAVQQNGNALRYVHPELKEKTEALLQQLRETPIKPWSDCLNEVRKDIKTHEAREAKLEQQLSGSGVTSLRTASSAPVKNEEAPVV